MNAIARYARHASSIIVCILLLSRTNAQEAPTPASPTPALTYRLECADPNTHRFHVEIGMDTDQEGKIAFAIPAWSPGYYQILHFETTIDHIAATDASGAELAVTHPTSREWDIDLPHPVGHVTFAYDVRAQDDGLGFFGSMLDGKQKLGYINGSSALMYLVDHKETPSSLTVSAPPDWKVACPLPEMDNTIGKPGEKGAPTATFQAKDYDELVDSPVQLGKFDEISYRTDGIGFRCILVGNAAASRAKLVEVLRRISHAEIQLFSGAPFKSYIFFFHSGGAGFAGGLEHRNSTVIHLFRPLGDGSDDTFMEVAAHELFHAWNVKHLHPVGLGPFDYTQAVRSGSLWWAEGVTDYYAEVILVRAGLRTRDWFLDVMAGRIAILDNTPSRTSVSLVTASRKAWEGQSEGFNGLSYYLKGSLVGFYLDLKIRAVTYGNRSLDDVMRSLDTEYGNAGLGYPDEALEKAVESVAGSSFKSEFDRYVAGTDEIDWKSVLPPIGFSLERTRGGYLGVGIGDELGTVAVVSEVSQGSPAERIGLRKGDKIRDINSVRVTGRNFATLIRACIPMTHITLLLERGNARISLSGTVGERFSDQRITVIPDSQVSAKSRHIRDTYLPPDAPGEHDSPNASV